MNEYATYAIKDLYFNNITLNSTGNVGCHDKNVTSQEKNIADFVQEKVSHWSIYYSLGRGIPCLITSCLLSSLSDKFGRQRLLFVSMIGTCMKMVMCTFAIHYRLNIYYFVIFGFVEGCFGGWITVLSISFAYLADMSSPGNFRSVAIAIYELLSNIGYFSGILLSGLLIKQFDGYFFPSVVSTVAIFIALFSIKFLPETIPHNKRTESTSFVGQMKYLIRLFARKANMDDSLRLKYFLCITSLILIWIPQLGRGNIDLYYILSYPICFNVEDVGFFIAIAGSIQQFVTVAFIRGCQLINIRTYSCCVLCIWHCPFHSFRICQDDDHNILRFFFHVTIILYTAAAIYVFKFACVPILRSAMSKLTPEDKQGSLFGVIALFENICSMVGSVLAGAIYSATVPIYEGFVFFVMAGFYVVATVLILVLYFKMRENKELQSRYADYEKIQED